MVDIDEIIKTLEHDSRCIGYTPTHIKDAIKIIRMWQAIKRDSCEFDLIRRIEEVFFPSLMTRTIKIKVEVPVADGLARVEQIKNYTKKKLKIFDDVKEVIISV